MIQLPSAKCFVASPRIPNEKLVFPAEQILDSLRYVPKYSYAHVSVSVEKLVPLIDIMDAKVELHPILSSPIEREIFFLVCHQLSNMRSWTASSSRSRVMKEANLDQIKLAAEQISNSDDEVIITVCDQDFTFSSSNVVPQASLSADPGVFRFLIHVSLRPDRLHLSGRHANLLQPLLFQLSFNEDTDPQTSAAISRTLYLLRSIKHRRHSLSRIGALESISNKCNEGFRPLTPLEPGMTEPQTQVYRHIVRNEDVSQTPGVGVFWIPSSAGRLRYSLFENRFLRPEEPTIRGGTVVNATNGDLIPVVLRLAQRKRPPEFAGTLVVVAPKLLTVWKLKCLSMGVTTNTFHGVTRSRDVTTLSAPQVVLTTYPTLNSEYRKDEFDCFGAVRWSRVVLDDFNYVRSTGGGVVRAVLESLPTEVPRWMIYDSIDREEILLNNCALMLSSMRAISSFESVASVADLRLGRMLSRLSLHGVSSRQFRGLFAFTVWVVSSVFVLASDARATQKDVVVPFSKEESAVCSLAEKFMLYMLTKTGKSSRDCLNIRENRLIRYLRSSTSLSWTSIIQNVLLPILRGMEARCLSISNMNRQEIDLSEAIVSSTASTPQQAPSECSICFSDQHPFLVKMSHCSHTVCFECMQNIQSACGRHKQLRCPFCRSEVSVTQCTLDFSYGVEQIQDVVQSHADQIPDEPRPSTKVSYITNIIETKIKENARVVVVTAFISTRKEIYQSLEKTYRSNDLSMVSSSSKNFPGSLGRIVLVTYAQLRASRLLRAMLASDRTDVFYVEPSFRSKEEAFTQQFFRSQRHLRCIRDKGVDQAVSNPDSKFVVPGRQFWIQSLAHSSNDVTE